MKIYDITRVLQEAPVYPGSEPIQFERLCSPENGDEYRTSLITAESHMGTHADAASHFLIDGAAIDQMPLDCYFGPCRVVTAADISSEHIEAKELSDVLAGCERLVLRTKGSRFLSRKAAAAIVCAGIRAVVTDALSVAPPDDEAAIHRILLNAGIAIVENAILDGVPDGSYILSAFPVKIGGCDGSPVRAVLIAEN